MMEESVQYRDHRLSSSTVAATNPAERVRHPENGLGLTRPHL